MSNPWVILPKETKILILSWINLGDVKSVSVVCKEWSTYLDYSGFWQLHMWRRLLREGKDTKPIWKERFKSIISFSLDRVPRKVRYGWLFASGRRADIYNEMGKEDFAQISLYGLFGYRISFMFDFGEKIPQQCRILRRRYTFGLGDFDDSCWIISGDTFKGTLRFYHGPLNGDESIPLSSFGYGVFTWPERQLSYEGEIFYRLPHGKGTWYFLEENRQFIGGTFSGLPHGKGVNEKGESVEYVAGYPKEVLDEACSLVKRKRWKKET